MRFFDKPTRVSPAAILAGVVALAAIGVGGWWLAGTSSEDDVVFDPDLVAVVPFQVSGDAGYLEEGMIDLLAAELTGGGGLRVVDPRVTLAAWRRVGGTTDHAAAGLARALGAGRVLQGSVEGPEQRLRIAGGIHRTTDLEELARHEVEGPADSLPALVDRFLVGLLSRMGAVDARRVPELQGTSLPAIRAYLDGQRALRAGRFLAATRSFERAFQQDSTFARAGLSYAVAASFTTQPAEPGLRLAWQRRDRLSPRDQAMLAGMLGPNYPDWSTRPERTEAQREMTVVAPDRVEAWYLRGDYAYHYDTGSPLPDRLDRAERSFATAVALDPDFGPAVLRLTEIALLRRDTAQARRRMAEFLDTHPDGDLATLAHARMDRMDGRAFLPPPDSMAFDTDLAWDLAVSRAIPGLSMPYADAAMDWATAAAPDSAEALMREMGRYLFDRGRPNRALAFLDDRGLLSRNQRAGLRLYGALYWETGTSVAELQPDIELLEAVATARQDTARVTWEEAACIVGQAQARRSQWSDVRRWAGRLAVVGGLDSPRARYAYACAALLDATLAVETGATDARGAVLTLDRLHADGTASEGVLRDAATLVLARAYEQLGDLESALRAIRRRVVAAPGSHFLTTHLREEGRLAAELGRTGQAIDAYRSYLRLRSDPEPPVQPQVDLVRTELDRLTAEE